MIDGWREASKLEASQTVVLRTIITAVEKIKRHPTNILKSEGKLTKYCMKILIGIQTGIQTEKPVTRDLCSHALDINIYLCIDIITRILLYSFSSDLSVGRQ